MIYIVIIVVIIVAWGLIERAHNKSVVRGIAEIQKIHLTDHISDLWNFIISSKPVENYASDDEADFRSKAIKKWLSLNKQRMNLDFGYFDNSGSRIGATILDTELRKDNARIKPSEIERQNFIKSYISSIDDVLSDSSLQTHKILVGSVKKLVFELQHLNPDLKNNDEWKKMCKKWRVNGSNL